MKQLFSLVLMALVIFSAHMSLSSSPPNEEELEAIVYGMEASKVEALLGTPIKKEDNYWMYQLENKSKFTVFFQNEAVDHAILQFHTPLSPQQIFVKGEELVKVGQGRSPSNETKWIFLAKPEQGRLWKINHQHDIESLSWVKPFQATSPSRNYQALLEEF